MEEYLEAMNEDMEKSYAALHHDFQKVRTGRAAPSLVENLSIAVVSYGANMRLNELATVKAADARLLVLTPWDKTTIHDIERGIVSAGLGLNPSNDGKVIRVPVPALTKERRDDLVKQVRKMAEDAKVRIRHVRREYNDTFKNAEKDKEISEDECRRLLSIVQEATDAAIVRVDDATKGKEAEVLEV